MKFLADECIERRLVLELKTAGIDIIHVVDLAYGLTDSEVIKLANSQAALLLTYDKDFGELVFRQQKVTKGVILLRLHGCTLSEKSLITLAALTQHKEELVDAFTVIDSKKIRISRVLERDKSHD